MTNPQSNVSVSTESQNTSSTFNAMDFSSLARTLSLNLTLKLDHSNYIYWKTQVFTAIEALDLEGFVNGDLQERVFMMQPEGFEDKLYPSHVCSLNKALYGLHLNS